MSVLIKGMEMPTSCYECPFLDYEQGFCLASAIKLPEDGWYEPVLCPGGIKDGRHDDCPLVPVPPHGQLIDLSTVNLHDGPYEYDDWVEWALEQYQDAPIFAPADRPKEESDG